MELSRARPRPSGSSAGGRSRTVCIAFVLISAGLADSCFL